MKTVLLYILTGGASFWILNILIAAATGLTTADVIGAALMTILFPGVLVITYFITIRLSRSHTSGPSAALFMGVGVWLFAPLCITIAATFSGGGFHTWTSISNFGYLLLFSVFPVYTLMMSTYDGSLFALFIASIVMVILHLTFERGHWLLPPVIRAFWRFKRQRSQ